MYNIFNYKSDNFDTIDTSRRQRSSDGFNLWCDVKEDESPATTFNGFWLWSKWERSVILIRPPFKLIYYYWSSLCGKDKCDIHID